MCVCVYGYVGSTMTCQTHTTTTSPPHHLTTTSPHHNHLTSPPLTTSPPSPHTHPRPQVLVGETGVGKTALVEGLAQRIVAGDVPYSLMGCRVVELDVGECAGGGGGGAGGGVGGRVGAGDVGGNGRVGMREFGAGGWAQGGEGVGL